MARKQLGPAANLPEDAATKADVDKKANIGHTHALPDPDLIGTLPMSKGGTGATSPNQARLNLGAASENHNHSLSGYSLTGTLPISRGGTGGTTASEARGNLGAASENHIHTLSGPDLSGTLPVSRGGTGASTASQALSNLGGAWAIARPLTTQHLDDVRTPGFYSQVVALDAQTVQRGYPIPQAGLMEVLSSSDGSLLWQRYTPTGGDTYSEWIRALQSGVWGPWRRSSGEPRGYTTDWWWMPNSDGFWSELYLRAENGYLQVQGYLAPRGLYLTGAYGIGTIPAEYMPEPNSTARVSVFIPTTVNAQGVSFYCKIESNRTLGLWHSPYQGAVTLYGDNQITPHIPPYKVVGAV